MWTTCCATAADSDPDATAGDVITVSTSSCAATACGACCSTVTTAGNCSDSMLALTLLLTGVFLTALLLGGGIGELPIARGGAADWAGTASRAGAGVIFSMAVSADAVATHTSAVAAADSSSPAVFSRTDITISSVTGATATSTFSHSTMSEMLGISSFSATTSALRAGL